MLYFLADIRNRFDFFMRKRMNLSRSNYSEKPQNYKDALFGAEQIRLYELLKQEYDTSLIENSTQRNFSENIYFLNVFNKFLSKKSAESISVLDIGSKNWSYVKSEHAFFSSFAKELHLNGIELDAYRLCTNLYTRYEIAKFYTKGLLSTEYIVGDFMEHNDKYDYIIWILPFIKKYPLIKWGLPLKYFKPKEMLLHAYNCLKDGGELLIINQGEEEYTIQQKLNRELGLDDVLYGEIPDVFNLFLNKRYCLKITKTS